jgi:Flp pilus assembly pilin Flp
MNAPRHTDEAGLAEFNAFYTTTHLHEVMADGGYSSAMRCELDRELRHARPARAAHDAGQNVVEYGLIIATIAVVVLLGTAAFGNHISPWFALLAGRITTTGT